MLGLRQRAVEGAAAAGVAACGDGVLLAARLDPDDGVVQLDDLPDDADRGAVRRGRRERFFRSTGSGLAGEPDSWGGEDYPGAGLFSLPGTGVYRCKAADIDRQAGRRIIRSYSKTLPLRDQAVGFAAVGKAVRVTTSIHPGLRGPLGQNASVRLGQPDTCQLSGLPIGAEAVRTVWPGKTVSAASLGGASTRVVNSGSFARSFPVNPSEGLSPGVKIKGTVRWSNAIVVVPALKRR